jgi:hypothetical protein
VDRRKMTEKVADRKKEVWLAWDLGHQRWRLIHLVPGASSPGLPTEVGLPCLCISPQPAQALGAFSAGGCWTEVAG